MADRDESYQLSADDELDNLVLHGELAGLPERQRSAVVLCYMQGLTYAAAAQRLGTSEVAIRGQLARARERLRLRLTRRGVAVPAGLLAAGITGRAWAAVPARLTHSTVRIAQGYAAGHSAADLARGVLKSMLINRVKAAAIVLGLGLAGSYGAWHAAVGADDAMRKRQSGTAAGKPAVAAPAPGPQGDRPGDRYRLTGSVRVEGTGEAVEGATFLVLLGDSGQSREVSSDRDGRFNLGLPPGQARSWTLLPPAGYWAPHNNNSMETFVLGPDHPVHQQDYVVRRGVVWSFKLSRGAARRPVPGGSVGGPGPDEFFLATADATGIARLTLPDEGGTVTVYASPSKVSMDSVALTIHREPGFRPDAVETMVRRDGKVVLTDAGSKQATVAGLDRLEPTIVDAKLVLKVNLPEPDLRSHASLTGRVLDERDRPIAGAKVALGFGEPSKNSALSADPAHTVATDTRGEYTIRSIPRRDFQGNPRKAFVVVSRQGYAGVDSAPIELASGSDDSARHLDPIRLASGFSLKGKVVDPQGRPAVGVWVTIRGPYALREQFVRTDDAGHFRVANLPKGLTSLYFEYGPMFAMGKYLADGTDENLEVRLRPTADAPAKRAVPAVPDPPAIGRPAPRSRSPAGPTRSRTLFPITGARSSCSTSGASGAAPASTTCRAWNSSSAKFEPRGVVFLSIHTPGEDIGRIRRFLELKKWSFLSALDEGREQAERRDVRTLRSAGLPDLRPDRRPGQRRVPQRRRHRGGHRRD